MQLGVEDVSDSRVVAQAQRLRALTIALELGVAFVVAASAFAFGAVHPWVYVPLWCACLGLAALLAARAIVLTRLRACMGAKPIALDATSRRVLTNRAARAKERGWDLDLSLAALPRPPLLLPGLLFAAWASLQLAPLPAPLLASLGRESSLSAAVAAVRTTSVSISPVDTRRGLAFLLAALVVHAAAATVLQRRAARRRLLHGLAWLGLLLGSVALVQLGTQTRRIYGWFTPLEGGGGTIFGPFVNRNHFAGYMLMIVPACLAFLARACRQYAWRVGERPNLRRLVVGLQSDEGVALVYRSLPALVSLAALLATTSRGALAAFAVSLAAVGIAGRRRAVPLALATVGFGWLGLAWFGTERLEERFAQLADDSIGRTAVWRDTLSRMDGLWWTGSGLNTYAAAMSRSVPWTLPRGATPWPAELLAGSGPGAVVGFRTPPGAPRLTWYREAHNDYLQVLVETGLPGLLLALWGAAAALVAARQEPWRLAALTGLLVHEFVDFDLQIPALSLLFVTLAAGGAGLSEKGSGSPL